MSELLTDPKHFFGSFTVKELGRLMNSRPADLATRPRAHEMGIYKRYFDLIATGRKPPRSGSTTPAVARSRRAP